MSGVTTNIIPEQVAVKNITIAAGLTDGSKISVHWIFKSDNSNLFTCINDSLTSKKNRIANTEQIDAVRNKILNP